MDFSLTEEQQAVLDAAGKIFSGHLTEERRSAVERDAGFDRTLWAALADANLLGIAVSEDFAGSGLGFAELSILLEEAGAAAAPVPLWPALVLGALPIQKFGSKEQRQRLLPPVVGGRTVLTGALVEAGSDPLDPVSTARRTTDGWVLDGVKTCVPAGTVATTVLVPARTDEGGVSVFVAETGARGVAITPLQTTSGIPEARIELSGVEVGAEDVLGGGSDVLDWMLPRATAGLCSLMAGTCREAVRLTKSYAATRQQFGRAIATFQAVGQRAADAYIDAEAVLLTARQASWRLSAGMPAEAEVAIAKFWAAEGGQRVVHAAQHIHGGVGVDRSYPLHRYFLAAKQLELTLGGTTRSLLRLGSLMAEDPV